MTPEEQSLWSARVAALQQWFAERGCSAAPYSAPNSEFGWEWRVTSPRLDGEQMLRLAEAAFAPLAVSGVERVRVYYPGSTHRRGIRFLVGAPAAGQRSPL